MPTGTPLHDRTFALCQSLNYREWAGYYTVSSYETHHDHEYNAIRHGAALIDVSPIFKYLVTGPDATTLIDRVITREADRMHQGQVIYTPWCNEAGHVIDDGTVARLDEQRFRWTTAEPNLRWFTQQSTGLDVQIDDVSERVAALAVQGPTSAALLQEVADADVAGLKYFTTTGGRIAGAAVDISRTGFTGDLGYEIWIPRAEAVKVWDAIMAAGPRYGLRPAGMLALDVARIEAGLRLIDVDYVGARKALTAPQLYSPFEIGLGRLVTFSKERFVGREALVAEHAASPRRRIVGVSIDWPSVERLYEAVGLPPLAQTVASRVAVPVFADGQQMGRMTSSTWSPMLKQMIGLATVGASSLAVGSRIEVEHTVDAVRHRVPAVVTGTPFFNPPRKTAC